MKKIYFLAPLFLLLFACSEDDVDPIEVPLTACFDVNKTTLNVGDELQITSCSEGAASFSYSFGAGATKTEPNPTFAYETAGEFTIKLTVTAADGRTDVAEKVVRVNSVQSNFIFPTTVDGDSFFPINLSFADGKLVYMENKQNIFENNSRKINYVELDMEDWSFSKSFITAPSFNANNAFFDTMDNGEKQAHVVNSLADRIGITKLTFDSDWGNASTAVNMLTTVLYGSMRSDENLIQYGAWRTSNSTDSLFSYFKRPSIEIKNNEGELVERKLYTEIEQGFIGNMIATDNGYIAFGGLMDSLTFTTFENYRPMVILLDADFEYQNHVEYTNTSISATNFNDLNASYQIEVLPNGNYLIYSHTELRIIDASGSEVMKEELPEQSFLQGLVVIDDGNFIISAEDQLRKYDINGTLLKALDLDIRLTPDLVANEGLVYFASGFDTSFETEAGNFSTIHTFIGAVNTNLEVVNLNE